MNTKARAVAEHKVFGLPAVWGRWGYVLIGLLMNLCLGSVYAWSVFRAPLAKAFSTEAAPITAMQTLWPFMLFLGFFTVFMPVSGKLVQRYSPRLLGIAGGIVVGLGWILSSYATSIYGIYVAYGVLAGIGVGFAYGLPLAVVARWFPDRKGLAVGITVLGFGVSALVMAPLAQTLIQAHGVLLAFKYLGILFLFVLAFLSSFLRFPPPEWRPAVAQNGMAPAAQENATTGQIFRSKTGIGLWLCFLFGSVAGLMAIGISSSVGVEIIKLDATTSTALVSLFAVFNGAGRPLFGWLTDKILPHRAAALSLGLVAVASLAMLLFAEEGAVAVYVVCFCAFWLGLGSWLAIAPTTTLTFFGLKNFAPNYGWMFSAYGLGAIIAGLIAGNAKDIFGSYLYAFGVSGLLAVLGIVFALTLMRDDYTEKNRLR